MCDYSNHCIQLFSPEGNPLKCVRSHGLLQFYAPNYIAIHPHSKKIYISDYCGGVQVLNSDLTYDTSFGDYLVYLHGIAIDSSGSRVYVVDQCEGRCVQVYTSDGERDREPIQQLL